MGDRGEALHLAVALDGAGWHPAAWREPDARPDRLFTAGYWADLARESERGLLDFVTIEDAFAMQSAGRTDRVGGRLDAVLIAARVGPTTSRLGFVPTATTTHTEPFHVSKSIATLDYVTRGRAGVRVEVSGTSAEARAFGRRTIPDIRAGNRDDPEIARAREDLFDEAADFVEVLRRLWDSWEDDAEIRDAATGRFIDRDRLHYIDFEGRWFDVRGPSITPRPPQGQPLVTALAHATVPYRLAARAADLVFVTPHDVDGASRIVREVRTEEARAARAAPPLRILADLVVFLDDDPGQAARRKARLDELDSGGLRSDAAIVTGTPAELADHLLAWRDAGMVGFRLRPGAIPHDLEAITSRLVPELQRRNAFRTRYEEGTLRARFGLQRPVNRYATV